MRVTVAIFCLLACSNGAWAQYGVSNQRNAYGNLVRDSGATSPRNVNQGPANNGPIRNSPAQPISNGGGSAKGSGR
jgi:hypothetical protein